MKIHVYVHARQGAYPDTTYIVKDYEMKFYIIELS